MVPPDRHPAPGVWSQADLACGVRVRRPGRRGVDPALAAPRRGVPATTGTPLRSAGAPNCAPAPRGRPTAAARPLSRAGDRPGIRGGVLGVSYSYLARRRRPTRADLTLASGTWPDGSVSSPRASSGGAITRWPSASRPTARANCATPGAGSSGSPWWTPPDGAGAPTQPRTDARRDFVAHIAGTRPGRSIHTTKYGRRWLLPHSQSAAAATPAGTSARRWCRRHTPARATRRRPDRSATPRRRAKERGGGRDLARGEYQVAPPRRPPRSAAHHARSTVHAAVGPRPGGLTRPRTNLAVRHRAVRRRGWRRGAAVERGGCRRNPVASGAVAGTMGR